MLKRISIAIALGVLTLLSACGGGASSSSTTVSDTTTNTSTNTSVSSTTANSASTYSTPQPYVAAVLNTWTPPTLTVSAAVTNRGRYLLSDSASSSSSANYLTIGDTYDASGGYDASAAAIGSSSSTYKTYLSKLVQLVSAADDNYRLDSHLHPNNSIDARTEDVYQLKFRNNFGKATTTYGYVTFSYDTTTKLLQAKNRYKYAYTVTSGSGTATYNPETDFGAKNFYVKLTGNSYSLVQSAAAATPFYFYDTPASLDLGIPTFMNPKGVGFVTNAAAPFKINDRAATLLSSITSNVNATYKNQVSVAGSDATTKVNADAMLASIKSTVEANGESLRYAPAVYSAFRDGALRTKLVSDSIADGTPGQNMVPYVYFTNEKDTSGKYHPFMIVVSYGNQSSPNGLKDIPRPPGDGTQPYDNGKVTRFSNLEAYITAIPMKNYGQVSAVTENSFSNLWDDIKGVVNIQGTTFTMSKNVYTWADKADNGLLIDGSVMFPIFNNQLLPAPLAGELSASGCHVGQGGGGPHCHADGYQSGFPLALYNDSDYLSKTHPPLIGFGYDGIALFGIYRSSDTAMLGAGTSLDGFGAHDHDGIGYHYHAHTVANFQPEQFSSDSSYKSTLHVLMKGAYIGKTASIPNFRQNMGFNNNKYLGGTVAP